MMKSTVSILLVLGTLSLATAFEESWCGSCVYAYLSGDGFTGRVYNCDNESPNGRICPPSHKCYSLKYTYHKTGTNFDLGINDPPSGVYTWIMEDCIFERRDPQRLCDQKLKQFSRLRPTQDHSCEIAVCEGDRCNRELTANFVPEGK
ncbi:hypothetical protein ACHWQZ_G018061 [Mnemiopsis leidyi]